MVAISASMTLPFILPTWIGDHSGMHRRPILNALEHYAASHPQELALVERFVRFVRSEPRCFERDCWSGHVTGSAWLVDRSGSRVLLTHHRKLGRWLQLGGHSDGDPDSFAVAQREAREESGLIVEPVTHAGLRHGEPVGEPFGELFDVDIHPIPARGDEPEHAHFDARYALRVVG